MQIQDLNTKEQNTWCPGCPNNGIAQAFKEAVTELVNEKKLEVKGVAIASGIGCHAKIYDYLNINAFYGIHGRVLPTILGIKLGNPKLKVIGFGGDGDTYAEGISHFVHNCRYNADLTMIVHNNQVFSLTTGQATPTSEKGFIGASTPSGKNEETMNPLALALISGASFIARGFALETTHLKEIIKQAIEHKGFAFVDVLQPCLIFHNVTPYFKKNIYKLENNNQEDFEGALKSVREWDYTFVKDQKVPIGIFYKKEKPTFGEQWDYLGKPLYQIERKMNWQEAVDEFK